MERIPGYLIHSSFLKSQLTDFKSNAMRWVLSLGLATQHLAKHVSLVFMELSAKRGRDMADKTAKAHG